MKKFTLILFCCMSGINGFSSLLVTQSKLRRNSSLTSVKLGPDRNGFSNQRKVVSSFKSHQNKNQNPLMMIGEKSKSLLSTPKNTLLTSIVAASALCLAFPTASYAESSTITTAMSNAGSMYEQFSQTGFYQALSLVFLSEIGDKTFFIAGLLAMKSSKLISFAGSLGALAIMTIISVLIGQIFHAVPSGIAQGIPLDDVAAVLAFTFFGVKTLVEAFDEEGGVMDEELEEAEEVVEELEKGGVISSAALSQIGSIFGLVFAAEFGDRSFLSTIALSAAQNPVGVAGGAILAHAIATGIAVSGGAVLAKYISEKVIGIISGCLFLVFAATTALGIF